MSRTPRLRLLVVAVVALGAVLLAATPASAHATLISTEPVGGTAVKTSPERVILRFSETVQIPLGSIRVFASPSGEQVETPAAGRVDGAPSAVGVKLPKLDEGTYIVTWRVTSADAHPIHGAFTFTVGAAKGAEADAALVQNVGAFAFVGLLWPVGAGLSRPRRMLWGAWGAAFVTTAVGIPVQAVYAGGLPLSKITSSTVVSGMFDDRFGQVWAARLGVLGLFALLLVALGRWVRSQPESDGVGGALPTPLLAAGGVLSVGLMLTPGLAGHAASEDLVPLAMTADVIHLLAASVWLGGLALLTAAVLPRKVAGELGAVIPRFSRLAFVSVITILVTGSFQGWRQVRSTSALTETTYGRLLIVKVLLFGLLIALAALSRRLVQARYRVPAARLSFGPGTAAFGGSRRLDRGDTPRPPTADPDADTVAALRRTVGAETLIAVVVLAVTSLLVNAQPARSALAQPFSAGMRDELVLVDVTVDPAKAGPADFHFYTLSPQGGQQDVAELNATLTLPSQEVGPLPVPLQRAGPGHFSAYNFNIPLRGEWKLEVKALISEIDEVTVSTTIPVR